MIAIASSTSTATGSGTPSGREVIWTRSGPKRRPITRRLARPIFDSFSRRSPVFRLPQAKTGFVVAARVVLEMAEANQFGLIVTTGSGSAASWAGVPREHVAMVLALQDKPS